ncbi:MAG: DUF504 domain-containing protein [Sulfuricella sp.]
MIPIQELLNRLRWDSAFATGDFVIGYYDRVEGKIIQVPLLQVHITPGDHFSCQVTDQDGYAHDVPFHRIKEVRKDDQLIWHREH